MSRFDPDEAANEASLLMSCHVLPILLGVGQWDRRSALRDGVDRTWCLSTDHESLIRCGGRTKDVVLLDVS